jgi:hypothetical protein
MAESGGSNREFDPFSRGLRVVFIDPEKSASSVGADRRAILPAEQRPEWVQRTTSLIDAVAGALPSPPDDTGEG